MLNSLAFILIIGFSLSGLLNRFKIPGLIGMIATGMILGPYGMNILDDTVLSISPELRKIALIIILMRAGLAIDLKDLKRIGRPAFLMSFIPATLEILAYVLLAPMLLDISRLEAAILGSVIAAVSPAVVVPRMLSLMESGKGGAHKVPQLVMAGASVDDIYVIVLFTAFLGAFGGVELHASTLLLETITAIVLGAFIGVAVGGVLVRLFKRIHMRDTIKVLILMSSAFLMVSGEATLKTYVHFSALLGVMAMGATVKALYPVLSARIKGKFSKLWVGAEIFLFVLVGAAVDFSALSGAGTRAVLLLMLALGARILGVFVSLMRTPLSTKQRLFCAVAYLPKATVQAAIGAIPLGMGVPSGALILSIAVLSIVITAPLGALGIDRLSTKWL